MTALRAVRRRSSVATGRICQQRCLQKRPSLTRCRRRDRKSTRLNSSHGYISYAVFCLKKKTRELVHDHDLAFDDHVVEVPLEERVGVIGLVHMVKDVHVGGVPEVMIHALLLYVWHTLI